MKFTENVITNKELNKLRKLSLHDRISLTEVTQNVKKNSQKPSQKSEQRSNSCQGQVKISSLCIEGENVLAMSLAGDPISGPSALKIQFSYDNGGFGKVV